MSKSSKSSKMSFQKFSKALAMSQKKNALQVTKWQAPAYPVDSLLPRKPSTERERFLQGLRLIFEAILNAIYNNVFRPILDRLRGMFAFLASFADWEVLRPHIAWALILILVLILADLKSSMEQREISYWMDQSSYWVNDAKTCHDKAWMTSRMLRQG
ncbi:MAG: hypothetical protein L6R41_007813 [Letrouitia leprolyta]|nr:MAG: hypothetical protein L6R41_007813 [Letrouitia leprolyta]